MTTMEPRFLHHGDESYEAKQKVTTHNGMKIGSALRDSAGPKSDLSTGPSIWVQRFLLESIDDRVDR